MALSRVLVSAYSYVIKIRLNSLLHSLSKLFRYIIKYFNKDFCHMFILEKNPKLSQRAVQNAPFFKRKTIGLIRDIGNSCNKPSIADSRPLHHE